MKPNGKATSSAPRVPAEIFLVVFEDGGITSFVTEDEATQFQKQIKRPTLLERFVVAKGSKER